MADTQAVVVWENSEKATNYYYHMSEGRSKPNGPAMEGIDWPMFHAKAHDFIITKGTKDTRRARRTAFIINI